MESRLAADEIAQLPGHLPLALPLAGSALAEREDLGAADYIRRLNDSQTRLQLVDASLAMNYDLLKPEHQRLWRLMAVLPERLGALQRCRLSPLSRRQPFRRRERGRG